LSRDTRAVYSGSFCEGLPSSFRYFAVSRIACASGTYMRLTANGNGDVTLRNRRVSALLGKKIGMSWVVISIVISVAVSYAVASTITVSSTTYQQILGGYISSTGGLTATDSGFSTAVLATTAAGTSSGSPITFGITTGTASSGVVASHWQWAFQVATTGSTAASTTFTVALTVNQNGVATSYTVYVATGGTVTSGQAINCIFDIGTSVTTPLSYTFTVK